MRYQVIINKKPAGTVAAPDYLTALELALQFFNPTPNDSVTVSALTPEEVES